jgi:hypothetical protein
MAQHRKYLERAAREADKERLRRARAAVRDALGKKRQTVKRARELCRAAQARFATWKRTERARLKEEIRALREHARTWPGIQRAHLREEITRRTAEVCHVCSGVADAREAGAKGVRAARSGLAQLAEERRRERTWSRSNPLAAVARAERRAESDEEVAQGLQPDELVVWQAVKARIKGTARMTRTEAFAHWMHDHPDEVLRLLEADSDAWVRRMEREEAEARKAMHKPLRKASDHELRARVSSSLEAVPF